MKFIKIIIKSFKLCWIKLACLLGLHAWVDGVCINCGIRK